ncbi:TPA: DNA repair protein [Vibrio vulnificus]|uniref:TerB family tellurite resistance protein n=1 Tax=Vibrio vulnificus TaxID=672 RepID=UPI0018657984|nr:TerB family tellurite resistance protein [Vibrio vulnificus]EGR7942991.1 DNA repair protein [Vibrio vulnificus]ELH4810978.1 TerB family tellurite resistance protein [Vibrio vulnificus]ELV8667285.1 TerB family tellurite resistance protein [Vibrio vulnificus]ELV8804587.1 TerB family tellurite resistance protein [Vibrio vulnificus]MCU8409765.1 TerB family tellurite resistance protein [Vibrio vulnificus]
MFIQNLDPKQQSALLYLAKEVIGADDDLHECEEQVLSLLMSQVDTSVTPEAISLDNLCALFDTNCSKASLLLELIGVAHADGDYHHNENALIKKYAQALDVTDEKLLKLEKWVSKQLSLSLDAQELLA